MVVSKVCFPLGLLRLILVATPVFVLERLKLRVNLGTAVMVLVALSTNKLKERVLSSWEVCTRSRETDTLVLCVKMRQLG